MANKKVVKKTKAPVRKKSKSAGVSYGYAIEHDFIIIAGGGFVVLFLVIAFFIGL